MRDDYVLADSGSSNLVRYQEKADAECDLKTVSVGCAFGKQVSAKVDKFGELLTERGTQRLLSVGKCVVGGFRFIWDQNGARLYDQVLKMSYPCILINDVAHISVQQLNKIRKVLRSRTDPPKNVSYRLWLANQLKNPSDSSDFRECFYAFI